MNKDFKNNTMNENSSNWRVIVLIITCCFTLGYIYFNEIQTFISKVTKIDKIDKTEKPVNKIEYSNGVILEKIFDIRRESKILIYKNNNNDIFTIYRPDLWKLVKPFDSVRVGYIQDTTSRFDDINFVSIEVLGVAKDTVKDFTIISEDKKLISRGSTLIRIKN